MKAILELKESAAWWFFKEKNSKCVKVEPKINFRLQLVPCLCEVVVSCLCFIASILALLDNHWALGDPSPTKPTYKSRSFPFHLWKELLSAFEKSRKHKKIKKVKKPKKHKKAKIVKKFKIWKSKKINNKKFSPSHKLLSRKEAKKN